MVEKPDAADTHPPMRVWAGMPVDAIPHRLNAKEAYTLLGVSRAMFFRLLAEKKIGQAVGPVPELLPRIGAPHYKGLWFRAYFAGELDRPHFFGKARGVPA